MRALAEREGIDLSESYAYCDSESDLPMLRAVGHPVAVNPDGPLLRVAREEGWDVLRFDRLGGRLKMLGGLAGAALLGAAGATARRRVGRPMSYYELYDEQREIWQLAKRFADEEIAPHAAAWDRAHEFPKDVFAALGELGLMGDVRARASSAGRARTSCPTSWSWRSCRAPTPGSA